MSFTDNGYEKTSSVDIIRNKEIQFEDLFDVGNNSISDVLWQWMKNSIYERQEIEDLITIGCQQMSISDARGIFLNKHGIECGITRKGASKAQGYVECTKNINKKAFTIPAKTQFSSITNTYESDESTEIPYHVILTKYATGESSDYFESSISEVTTIEKITNMQNEVISSDYYELDPIYKNNIQWTEESDEVLIKDQQYNVYLSGNVTKRVEVSSVATGPNANASIEAVTSCVQYSGITVSNAEEISGGMDKETDSAFRTRLLSARRRTFTLGNIRDIILGTEGVRACKIYQNVGTDQVSVADWDNPLGTGIVTITGTRPIYSQNFVPGDHVLTLGKITLYGDANNDPPALICGIKRDIDNWGTGATSPYFDYKKIEKWDLDQSREGMRDIEFNVNYNGLDKSKTYRFDVFCDNPGVESFDWNSNYWELATTSEGYGIGHRTELMQLSGTIGFTGSWVGLGNNIDLMFKTHFKGAGYTSIIGCSDGYGFNNVKSTITGMLDYIGASTNPGYSPICIQSSILEADEINVDLQVVVYISQLADFENVRRELEEDINDYLESLNIGENVVYSRIWQIIMDHNDVKKIERLYIKREDESSYVQRDLGVIDSEIVDLGSMSVQLGGRL